MEITDEIIEQSIFNIAGGGDYLIMFVIATISLILYAFVFIKYLIISRRENEKLPKAILLTYFIGLILTIVITIICLNNLDNEFIISRIGLFVFPTILFIGSIISLRKITIEKITRTMCYAIFTTGCILFMLPFAYFDNKTDKYEETDWYVSKEIITDLYTNGAGRHKNHIKIKGYDEQIPFLTSNIYKVRPSIDGKQEAWVVFSEDGEPLVSYDMLTREYVGERLVEE